VRASPNLLCVLLDATKGSQLRTASLLQLQRLIFETATHLLERISSRAIRFPRVCACGEGERQELVCGIAVLGRGCEIRGCEIKCASDRKHCDVQLWMLI
jgi:hypothetical protein